MVFVQRKKTQQDTFSGISAEFLLNMFYRTCLFTITKKAKQK